MPVRPPSDPDALISLEAELEDAFQDLAGQAEAAGWDAMLIACALQSLADNRLFALAANAETEWRIEEARDSNLEPRLFRPEVTMALMNYVRDQDGPIDGAGAIWRIVEQHLRHLGYLSGHDTGDTKH